jgi:hypothetical protein
MEPTYLHQYFLPAILPAARVVTDSQPISDMDIDRWLIANQKDSFRGDVLIPGYLHIDDTPFDQVLCYVFLVMYKVCCSSLSLMTVLT